MPYIGSLDKLPRGWYLCDGSNGTPDLRNRFLEGAGAYSVTSYIEAALPNLQGSTGNVASAFWGSYPTGVFTRRQEGVGGDSGGDYAHYVVNFNASNYSRIYKDDCTTVQPPAYTVYYIIRVF